MSLKFYPMNLTHIRRELHYLCLVTATIRFKNIIPRAIGDDIAGIFNISSYEELVKLYPDNDDYRLYYAQALYKSGQYIAAQKACASIDNPAMSSQVKFREFIYNNIGIDN